MSNLDAYIKQCEDFKHQENSDALFFLKKNQFDELFKLLCEKLDKESSEEVALAIDLDLSAYIQDKLTSNNRSDWNDYEWCARQSLNAFNLYEACKRHDFNKEYIAVLWTIACKFKEISKSTLNDIPPKKNKGRPSKSYPLYALIDFIADCYEAYSTKKGDHFTKVVSLILTFINYDIDDVDSLIKRALPKSKINRIERNVTEI